jgi:hypothetical protein
MPFQEWFPTLKAIGSQNKPVKGHPFFKSWTWDWGSIIIKYNKKSVENEDTGINLVRNLRELLQKGGFRV